MNKERRTALYDVIVSLDEAQSLLQDIMAEEEDAFDSLTSGLQFCKTGVDMQDAIEKMQGFSDRLDELKAEIEKWQRERNKKARLLVVTKFLDVFAKL